jgi:hypothetical protein
VEHLVLCAGRRLQQEQAYTQVAHTQRHRQRHDTGRQDTGHQDTVSRCCEPQ